MPHDAFFGGLISGFALGFWVATVLFVLIVPALKEPEQKGPRNE